MYTGSIKLSPGGQRQFTLSPIRDYDRTQELVGLTLLVGRVPMPASYPHSSPPVVQSIHNIFIFTLYVSTLAFYGGDS